LTDQDIRNLDNPQKENFTPQYWAAVAFAREWALNRGEVKDREIVNDFESNYEGLERERITAVMRIMDFANKFNNTWSRPLKRHKYGYPHK